MKIISWNVNGIRAVAKNGFLDWLFKTMPDVLCLQETKAQPEIVAGQIDDSLMAPLGYQTHWHSAQKPGYSGVALYTRQAPLQVLAGLGVDNIDCEGRVLTALFENFVVVNAYFPNSQREHTRLDYKLKFCAAIFKHVENLRKKYRNVVLCGDYNIAHREIDLKNPKTNQDNAGFLPEERAWMDSFLKAQWVDAFRAQHPGLIDQYTWWSYRPTIRERNIGWRIDYHCVSQELYDRVTATEILADVKGSDHCPVTIELKL